MKKLFFSLTLALLCAGAQAQQSFFKPVAKGQLAAETASFLPKKYDTYTLDEPGLRAALEAAPWEFEQSASKPACIVELPTAQGAVERFSVFRVAMLDEELAAAYPEIRTYAGICTADPRLTVRFSVTPRGFRALVMRPDFSAALVRPLEGGSSYIAFEHADASAHGLAGMKTGVDPNGKAWFDGKVLPQSPAQDGQGKEVDPVKLRIFRYCAAASGEFTQDHGGTKPLALAAVTEYTNQVSAIFERDMAMRLQLTNATQYVIFTDPATDPYNAGPTVQDYMAQNPSVLNFYTNFNSHDLGHVYTRYLGGSAIGVAGGIGVACGTNKAAGCSAGLLGPTGDYGSSFLVVIGQEVGHQMGGGHTWNRCNGGDGRQGITAFEPGSGSTIMSYAGACAGDNIQSYSDLYFHAGSIEEIRNYFTFTASCGSLQNTPNNPPVVTLNYPSNFNIPISTPFELNGSATDADGDPLTYTWEGIDTGPETPLGQPQGNAAIFRTWPAASATNRYFPRLQTILSNGFNAAEQLPTYSRDLSFRLTARDNRPNGGGVGWADVYFRATAAAGPFLVTSPNTASATWRIGELTRVQWDVANTDAPPVNCQKVNIRLSTDGGLTYPITLAADTENDGSQYVAVPDLPTSLARVRVEAADNVFFDLSNANFKIQAPVQPSLTLGLSADAAVLCLPANFVTEVNTASVLGYSTPVALELLGNLPPGATVSFSSATVLPGNSSTLTVNMANVSVQGTFDLTLRAVSGADTLLRPIKLTLRRNDFSGFALLSPANGTTNAALTQTLRWGKGLDAAAYDVQFSDSPSFAQILASANGTALDSMKVNFLLQKGKAYFWRVRPSNSCGAQPWSEPFFFSTFAENCLVFEANDLPKSISASGTPTVESKINVFQGASLSDLVVTVSGYHDYFRDLEATLISPQGTQVTLWKNRCGNSNGTFNFGMSDSAPSGFVCPPPTNGAVNRPQTPLSPIIGQNSTGTWTLRIKDDTPTAGGSLNSFGLQFCQSLDVQPPFLIKNDVMPLPSGLNQPITADYLLMGDPNNTPEQLLFTLMTLPKHGALGKQGVWGDLQVGDQFTQADINAGLVRFYDYGYNTAPDGFRFMVTDGEGGFFGTPLFVVQPFVGISSPSQQKLEFSVFPNPAEQTVWVAFGQKGLESVASISLFNMNGQLALTEKLPPGTAQWPLAVGQLPKGIYAVKVESETHTGVRRLVIH